MDNDFIKDIQEGLAAAQEVAERKVLGDETFERRNELQAKYPLHMHRSNAIISEWMLDAGDNFFNVMNLSMCLPFEVAEYQLDGVVKACEVLIEAAKKRKVKLAEENKQ